MHLPFGMLLRHFCVLVGLSLASLLGLFTDSGHVTPLRSDGRLIAASDTSQEDGDEYVDSEDSEEEAVIARARANAKVRNWSLVGVSIHTKASKIKVGRIVISVDTEDPMETLKTGHAIAERLINREVLDAIQLWAFPRRHYELELPTAWIEFSVYPGFYIDKASTWRHRMARKAGETPSDIDFQFFARLPNDAPDPVSAIRTACKGNLMSCEIGRTSL